MRTLDEMIDLEPKAKEKLEELIDKGGQFLVSLYISNEIHGLYTICRLEARNGWSIRDKGNVIDIGANKMIPSHVIKEHIKRIADDMQKDV